MGRARREGDEEVDVLEVSFTAFRAFVFSDGSLLESGNVGGGAFVVGMDGREQEVECGMVKKAGKTGKARSRQVQRTVNAIKTGGEVKIGWVKVHMGILGNEAADVLAKNAAEGKRDEVG